MGIMLLLQSNNFRQSYKRIHIYQSVLQGTQLKALDIIAV